MPDQFLPGVEPAALESLEEGLRSVVLSRDLPLYQIMAYHMGWVDEKGHDSSLPQPARLHGQFVAAVASGMGGDPAAASRFGVPVELAYNSTLIHDDVENGNTERAGRPSVWWTWGPAQAINAGDGMQALARLSVLSQLKDDGDAANVSAAVAVLDNSVMRRCEGEYLDITYQEKLAVSTADYLEMAEARGGSLVSAAASLASLACGQDARTTDAMGAFGRLVGTARQVNFDMAALWSAERNVVAQGRLISKKKSLPIVHVMEKAPPSAKRALGELYMQRVIDPAKIDQIAATVEEAGGRAEAERKVRDLIGSAAEALEEASLSGEARRALMESAESMAVSFD